MKRHPLLQGIAARAAPVFAALCLLLLPVSCGKISEVASDIRAKLPDSIGTPEQPAAPILDPNKHLAGGMVHAANASDLPDLISSDPRLVVIDFYADWCGPCRMLAPVLEQVAGEFADSAIIVKVDTDQNRNALGRYGIRGIPDVRFYLNGNEVDRFTGFLPIGEVRRKLARHTSSVAVAATAEEGKTTGGVETDSADSMLERLRHAMTSRSNEANASADASTARSKPTPGTELNPEEEAAQNAVQPLESRRAWTPSGLQPRTD